MREAIGRLETYLVELIPVISGTGAAQSYFKRDCNISVSRLISIHRDALVPMHEYDAVTVQRKLSTA